MAKNNNGFHIAENVDAHADADADDDADGVPVAVATLNVVRGLSASLF